MNNVNSRLPVSISADGKMLAVGSQGSSGIFDKNVYLYKFVNSSWQKVELDINLSSSSTWHQNIK